MISTMTPGQESVASIATRHRHRPRTVAGTSRTVRPRRRPQDQHPRNPSRQPAGSGSQPAAERADTNAYNTALSDGWTNSDSPADRADNPATPLSPTPDNHTLRTGVEGAARRSTIASGHPRYRTSACKTGHHRGRGEIPTANPTPSTTRKAFLDPLNDLLESQPLDVVLRPGSIRWSRGTSPPQTCGPRRSSARSNSARICAEPGTAHAKSQTGGPGPTAFNSFQL